MDITLKNRRALVCGGSRGIGLAVAHELADLGAEVHLLARTEDTLQSAVDKLSTQHGQHHSFTAVNMLDTRALDSAIVNILRDQPLHIWIHNTGGPPAGALLTASPEELMEAFQIHIISAQCIAHRVVPSMKSAKYGRIVHIISTSVKEPIPRLGVSNTIRGAMGNWSKTMATELGPDGITVNNILPGFTATDRLEKIIESHMKRTGSSRLDVEAMMKSVVPLGRFAEPSEIASVAAFLCTPAASYVNGINVPVDGGRTKSL